MKVLVTVVFLLLFQYNHFLYAQDVFGGNPSSIHWRQYNTDTARVIYPAGMDSQALKVAQIVHFLNHSTGHSIGTKVRKINIVFQKDVTFENGFVALGPFRSEFYLNPPQDVFSLGTLPPYVNLAIHEYRHVQQYTNFNRGFSKVLSVILGEQGQDLGNALTVPNWFFEGDAVFQETLVSGQGRGRLPSFLDDFTALWTGDRHYTWMQWRNGSFRSLIPNWYPLGYIMVSYGRTTYGPDIWKNIAGDAAAAKGGFYPFQRAVKRYTGASFTQFREQALDAYKARLLKEDTSISGRLLTPLRRHDVMTYQQTYPGEGQDRILARNSYSRTPAFYRWDEQGLHKIRSWDIAQDTYFSYRSGKIVYAAYQPDLRWGLRTFNDIRLLDVKTGSQRSLTWHQRYFSPDINPDGTQIVAVQVPSEGSASLQILSVKDGHVLDSLPNPEHYFYVMPRWSDDGKHILAGVRDLQGRMSLWVTDRETHVSGTLLPFSFHPISSPFQVGDTIYFSTEQGKGVQLMAFVQGSGTLFQLTHGIRSHYTPTATAGQVTWTTPAADGMSVYTAPLSTLDWTALPTDSFARRSYPLLDKGFLSDSALGALFRLDTNRSFASGVYHKTTQFFNFHSFRPYYVNPDWSVTLYGQNILNTFQSQAAYDYNQNEQSSTISAGGTYAGWYPWLSGSVGYTFHRTGETREGNVVHWDELQAGLGTSVPFNFSKGRFYHFLTPSVSLQTEHLSIPEGSEKYFSLTHIEYLQWGLSWSSQIQQSIQQIFPHWAHSLTAAYQRSTFGNPYSWQFLVQGSVYLPGLWNTHSLVLSGAYQRRDTLGHYSYTNDFPGSRGYPGIDYPQMYKWSANYHFPLVYPDWGFGNILYFQRIRANLLYDQTVVDGLAPHTSYQLRSTGLEIYFETQWWNQQPITIGVGYYRLLDHNLVGTTPNQWQILLPILF